jgi:hypothetical protein
LIATAKAADEVGELIGISIVLKNVGRKDTRISVGDARDV